MSVSLQNISPVLLQTLELLLLLLVLVTDLLQLFLQLLLELLLVLLQPLSCELRLGLSLHRLGFVLQ